MKVEHIPAAISVSGNMARASLVYGAAVRAALDGNRLSVFATDVFPEKLPPAHDLLDARCIPFRP